MTLPVGATCESAYSRAAWAAAEPSNPTTMHSAVSRSPFQEAPNQVGRATAERLYAREAGCRSTSLACQAASILAPAGQETIRRGLADTTRDHDQGQGVARTKVYETEPSNTRRSACSREIR